MVMLSSTLRGRVVKFQSPVLPPRELEVLSLTGEEAISRPYQFEIEMVSKNQEMDVTEVIKNPVLIGMKQGLSLAGGKRGIRTLKIHGVLRSFEQGDKTFDWVTYRAVVVPRIWKLSLNIQTRIFQDLTVPEIIEEVLKESGMTGDEYELKTDGGTYPKREYVVQYQESDLDFISRLAEHEGICYFFEQGDECEKVIFGDATGSHQPLQGVADFQYNPLVSSDSGGPPAEWYAEETIQSLGMKQEAIQKEVCLRDYNYRTPATSLLVSTPVVDEGVGRLYSYGDHYKDEDSGKVYAEIRAEEIRCRQKVWTGKGQVRSFRAGWIYNLGDHYRPDFNQGYLITRVRHTIKQSIELTGGMGVAAASYENEFDTIPEDVVFRPGRVTPRPRITGIMHAKIDASGDGKYAEIDDEGRYKVSLPFDLSGKDKGKASRWMRMAQPYTGPDFGFHFPVHKGAEVVLIHLNGDPDRPIISAAVPNPETASPVKGENQSQCVIRTGGGNQVVIEDTEGAERVTLSSPHSGTTFSLGSGD